MQSRKLRIAAYVISFVVLGFIREFFFVHTNDQIRAVYYNQLYPLPQALGFLKTLSYNQLYTLKWVLTLVFFLLFFALSYKAIKDLTNIRSLKKAVIWSYTSVFVVSGLAIVIGSLTSMNEEAYSFARFFMGIGQSPVIFMMIYASSFLKLNNQ
jgi:hypothetical protein